MSDWRSRGYVPNSDDEGENLSLPHHVPRDEADGVDDRLSEAPLVVEQNFSTESAPASSANNDTSSSTAQQLERVLSHGLQTVRHVLTTTTSAGVVLDGGFESSANDSPLSSPPSSNNGSQLTASAPPFGLSQSVQQPDDLQQAVYDALAASAPRRNLRTRALIQQHPYALEDALYRQQMKNGGLKPVHVPLAARPTAQERSQDESQLSADFQSSQIEESYDLDNQSQSTNGAVGDGMSMRDSLEPVSDDVNDRVEDGLPDLSVLLSKPTRRQYKSKRRGLRVAMPSSNKDATSTNIFDIPDGDELVHSNSLREARFRIPPSPPHSDVDRMYDYYDDDVDAIPVRKVGRRPGTPGLLPTPLMSSDHGHRKRPVTIVESSESSESDEELDVSATSSEAEEGDSQGLTWIRNKLKGVLPPSFLRLDMQTRVEDRAKQKHLPAVTTQSVVERGVARRTASRPSQLSSRPLPTSLLLMDLDNSSDEEIAGDSTTAEDVAEPLALTPANSGDDFRGLVDSIVEEYEVDHMLPSTRQSRSRDESRKHRQTRLDAGWGLLNRRTAADSASAGLIARNSSGAQGQKTKSTMTKRRKVRHRRQRMAVDVLDAPSLREMKRDVQPAFLRIAARQAKKGSQSKTYVQPKKILQFETANATRDINEEFEAWRKSRGRRGQSQAVARANVSRTQVVRVSHNSNLASLTLNTSTSLGNTAQPTALGLSTQPLVASWLNNLPNSTPSNNSVLRDPPSLQSLRLRGLFAHRNRSGQGLLLSRLPQPRAAQIEASIPAFSPVTGLPLRTVVKPIRKTGETLIVRGDQPNIAIRCTLPILRPPKKQVPRKSFIPTAKMDLTNPLDAPDAPRPNVETELRIAPALAAVEAIQQLTPEARFHHSVVGEEYLNRAIKRLTKVPYRALAPTNRLSSVSTPISHHKTMGGMCDDRMGRNITAALDETFNTFCERPVGTLEQCKSCVTSIHEILYYLGEAACFTDIQAVQKFVHTTKKWVEKFLARFDDENVPQERRRRAVIIDCLNHLAVLTLYLYDLAKADTEHPVMVTDMKDLCFKLVDRIAVIVLDHTTLLESVSRLSDMYDNFWQSFESFPEADSVVVRWHIHRTLSARHSNEYFYSHLKSLLCVKQSTNRTNRLNTCLLALCFTLPLLGFDSGGVLSDDVRVVQDIEDECFSLLAEHVEGFVKGPASSNVSDVVGPLLEAVEDICLKMVKQWKWSPTPLIITVLWQAYMWNSWLPFHSCMPIEEIFEDLRLPSHLIEYQKDNDCYKFLELVESCIESLCWPRSDGIGRPQVPQAAKIKSLAFKLLPNSAEKFDARSQIPAHRLLALKNIFALRIKLFTIVPEGCQPRLRDLKDSVDFSSSHGLVCKLALSAWKAIATFYIEQSDPNRDTVEAAGEWMGTMLQQSLKYLRHNNWEAITRVTDILSTFIYVMKRCDAEPKARVLFYSESVIVEDSNGDKVEVKEVLFDLIEIILNRPEIHRYNNEIMILATRLLLAYARSIKDNPIEETLITKSQVVLRKLVQHVLTKNRGYSDSLMRSIMEAWFFIAHVMVKTFHKHWNDFVNPHSNLSIDFLSGLRESYASYEAKACFYSDLITNDTTYYYLECRPIVFITWVASLLFPVRHLRFGHVLTNSILNMERESLMIGVLAEQLFQDGTTRELDQQALADCRVVILRHIIQNIHGQQEMVEEEWLAGGLDFEAMRTLLRTMTKTMKDQWLELKPYPDAQNDYTALIYSILNELETYPVAGFKIDSWFSGASEFPRPVQTLDNAFKCRLGEPAKEIDHDLIRSFIQHYRRELIARRDVPLVQEWLRVFHCTDPLRSRKQDDTIQYSIDIVKQEKLIQVVVPVFFDYVHEVNSNIFINTLLVWLTELTKLVVFRIDNLNPTTMNSHVMTVTAILCGICQFLEKTHLRHAATVHMLRYTRCAMTTIFSLFEVGIEIEQSLYENCIANILGIYAVVVYHLDKMLEPGEKKVVVAGQDSTTVEEWNFPVENFELVPDEQLWMVRFDAAEPELSEKEKMWRKQAMGVLMEAGRAVGKKGLSEHSWGFGDREELRVEMMGLVRDLKARELVGEEDDEDDEDE